MALLSKSDLVANITANKIGFDRAMNQIPKQVKTMAGSVNNATQQVQKDTKKTKTLVDKYLKSGGLSFLLFGKTTGSVLRRLSRDFISFQNLLIAVFTFRALKKFVSVTDELTLLEGRLRVVADSEKQVLETRMKLLSISNESRTDLYSTIDLYTRLARSTNTLKVSQEDLLETTKAITKALTISGASQAEIKGALVQFGQALASDRLSGDEMRSIKEQTPRIAQAIADGLNITLGTLKKWGEEGKLTTKAMVKALLSQREILEAEFKLMPKTVGQALQGIKNSFFVFFSELNRYIGLNDTLTKWAESFEKSVTKMVQNKELFMFFYEAKRAASDFMAVLQYAAAAAIISNVGAITKAIGTMTTAIWNAELYVIGLYTSLSTLSKIAAGLVIVAAMYKIADWATRTFKDIRDLFSKLAELKTYIIEITKAIGSSLLTVIKWAVVSIIREISDGLAYVLEKTIADNIGGKGIAARIARAFFTAGADIFKGINKYIKPINLGLELEGNFGEAQRAIIAAADAYKMQAEGNSTAEKNLRKDKLTDFEKMMEAQKKEIELRKDSIALVEKANAARKNRENVTKTSAYLSSLEFEASLLKETAIAAEIARKARQYNIQEGTVDYERLTLLLTKLAQAKEKVAYDKKVETTLRVLEQRTMKFLSHIIEVKSKVTKTAADVITSVFNATAPGLLKWMPKKVFTAMTKDADKTISSITKKMEAMNDEAEKALNTLLKNVTKWENKTTVHLAKLQNSILKSKYALTGLGMEITRKLLIATSPAGIGDSWWLRLKEFQKIVKAIDKDVDTVYKNALKKAEEFQKKMTNATAGMAAGILNSMGAFSVGGYMPELRDFALKIAGYKEQTLNYDEDSARMKREQDYANKIKKIDDDLTAYLNSNAIKLRTPFAEIGTTFIKSLNDSMIFATPAINMVGEALDNIIIKIKKFKDLNTEIKKMEQNMASVAKTTAMAMSGSLGWLGTIQEFISQVAGAAKPEIIENSTEEMTGFFGRLKNELDVSKSQIEAWGTKFTDTIFDMVVTGKASFKDLFTTIATDIVKAGITKFITAPLFGALGFPIPGRAIGGPVSAMSPYVVGEKGPELFVPKNNGQIIPNDVFAGMSSNNSGVVIQFNNNFAEGVNEAARAEILKAMPIIRKQAVDAVQEAQKRRGGR